MIDTHCHIDLYPNPLEIAMECESLQIIVIGMTNLPSHFEIGYSHIRRFNYVRLALGMHPLNAEAHEREWPGFVKHLSNTSYVGEVGLDFSDEGISSKKRQLQTFKKILAELSRTKKIVSLHSRRAEKEVLTLLIQHKIMIAIFHWYSGPPSLVDEIVKAGYYFSVNSAMIKSKSGREIVSRIPLSRLLTESDGPFVEIEGVPAKPKDVSIIHKYLAVERNADESVITSEIRNNFHTIVSRLKSKKDF